MPTARNARGVDVVAYSRDCSRFIGVQVKALSKRYDVPLGNSLDKIIGDFWAIVTNVVSEPNAYVLLPEEVKELAGRDEKDGRVSYWLPRRAYDTEKFKEAWNRLIVNSEVEGIVRV